MLATGSVADESFIRLLLLAAQQFSTGIGLRASCQHAAEKALGGRVLLDTTRLYVQALAAEEETRKLAGVGEFCMSVGEFY
jgi:hypothetical protein